MTNTLYSRGNPYTVVAQSGTYNANKTEFVISDGSDVTLPSAEQDAVVVVRGAVGGNTTVLPPGSKTVQLQSNGVELQKAEDAVFVSDGSNWYLRKEVDFAKLDIPDSAVIYLDARDDSTISTTSGNVDGWTDKVTGTELTGSAGSLGDINGNQAITFNAGSSHELDNTNFSDYSPPWTAFVVVDYNNNSLDATPWSDTGGRPAMRSDSNDDWRFIRDSSGSDLVGSTDTTVQLLTCIATSSGGFLRENGTETGDASQAGGTLSPLIIGDRSNEHWNGQIGLFSLHDKELSGSELTDRESEIMSVWGI